MKLFYSKHKAIIHAFIINTLFLAFAFIFCCVKYEVSDDFMIDAVLSGAYGDNYNPNLLFSNAIFGYLLTFLYKIFPAGSIYFYSLIILAFISFITISYIIMKKNTSTFGFFLVFLLVAFFSDDYYISITFTKVATIQLISGGLLLLHSYVYETNRRKKILLIILGSLQFLMGFTIRFDCLFIALGFLGILTVYLSIHHYKHISKENYLKFLLPLLVLCASLIGICFILNKWDYTRRVSSPYEAELKEYKSVTDKLENIYKYDYDTMQYLYEELGLSENDYWLLYMWNFVDDDVFSKETLTTIADEMEKQVKEHVSSPSYCFSKLAGKKYYMYPSIWCLVILLLLVFIKDRKKAIYYLGILGLVFALLYYCTYTGKLPYRVEFSLFICAAFSMAYLLSEVHTQNNKMLVYAAALLFLCKLPLYMPDTNYKTMNDSDYFDYVFDAMTKDSNMYYTRYKVDLSHRRFLGNLIDMIESDNEHYYLVAFNPLMQMLYYNYNPWERIPMGYLKNNYNYVGGVNYGLGYSDEALASQGIDPSNPNKSLIDNEKLIWVELFPDYELTFLREHYGEDIEAVYYGTIDYIDLYQFKRNQD